VTLWMYGDVAIRPCHCFFRIQLAYSATADTIPIIYYFRFRLAFYSYFYAYTDFYSPFWNNLWNSRTTIHAYVTFTSMAT